MPDLGINVKRYPTCYCTHRAIDAMIDLARDHDLKPDAVKEIRVRTGTTQMLMLRNSNPQTGLEAKFSMEFAMAAALVAGRVGLAELTDEFVRRPEIAVNVGKVKCTTVDETIPGLPMAPDDRVSVVLATARSSSTRPSRMPRAVGSGRSIARNCSRSFSTARRAGSNAIMRRRCSISSGTSPSFLRCASCC